MKCLIPSRSGTCSSSPGVAQTMDDDQVCSVVSHEIVQPIYRDAKSVHTTTVARRIIEPVWGAPDICFATDRYWLRRRQQCNDHLPGAASALFCVPRCSENSKRFGARWRPGGLSSGGLTDKGSWWPFYFSWKLKRLFVLLELNIDL